jgi:hypothetical protein
LGTRCTRFRKKFTKGTATPAREIEGVKKRLAEAEWDYHVQATRDSSGSYAMIYVPAIEMKVRVDLRKIALREIAGLVV